ncbi:UDP-N-acetylmuramate dehydrogenase [uncultured Murdochiella sp.]|uniref:UDP-N-acetylmuramate dehydrogenase n=1 Tax=uncultured Murdochiella sp. TaxID=1586095 RepID=UPI002804B681|nr:UDP-N-acetylmuramate dehydrogenase [uncultured Murdochiella sp.]
MIKENQRAELRSGAYGIVTENVCLSSLTTFHLGGPCDLLIEVTSEKEALRTIRYLRSNAIPFFVIGNGSNLLVRDGGLDGVVVKMGPAFSDVTVDGNFITAQAGAAVAKVAQASFRAGLTGMEALAGIPGTVGGGVIMNAGAYEQEMKDVLCSLHAIADDNTLCTLSREEMELGYRTSRMMRESMVVTEVTFALKPGNPEEIREKAEEFAVRRRTKQPLDKYSAGSTFKRPQGHFAGALIEQAGLRGYTLRGAKVSDKHCGFLINNGEATARDVLDLMAYVQDTVKKHSGVDLEPEVRIMGKE